MTVKDFLSTAQARKAGGGQVLWRGESANYPSTKSGRDRLDRLNFADTERDLLETISDRFLQSLAKLRIAQAQSMFGMHIIKEESERNFVASAIASIALQHYGFPTRFVDFTSDAHCALAFAASQRSKAGFILQVDADACSRSGFEVFDNSNDSLDGNRAAQQSSFLIHLPACEDIKETNTAHDVDLKVYEIRYTACEQKRYNSRRKRLLSIPSDDIGYQLTDDLHTFLYNEIYKTKTFALTDRVAAFLSSRCLPSTTFFQREALRRKHLTNPARLYLKTPRFLAELKALRVRYCRWRFASQHRYIEEEQRVRLFLLLVGNESPWFSEREWHPSSFEQERYSMAVRAFSKI